MSGAPGAVAMLADDGDARVAAVEAVDASSLEVRFALRDALAGDHDARVRAAAARALGRGGDGERAAELVDALDDVAPSVREAAFAALARLGAKAAIPFAQRALAEEPVWWVRRAAALTLAALAGPRAVEPLCRALEDPFWRVSQAAVRALTALGERDAVFRASVARSPAREGPGRAYVAWRLGEMDPRSVDAAAAEATERRPAFLDADPAVTTARLLDARAGALDPRELVPLLAASHEPLRVVAARRMAEAPDLEALEAALAWLDDPRVPNAADGLARALDGTPPATVSALAAGMLARGGEPSRLAWALGVAPRDAATLDAANTLRRHADDHLRRAALVTLASEEAWRDALDDEDETTRALAVAALAGSAAPGVRARLDTIAVDQLPTETARLLVRGSFDRALLGRASGDARPAVRAAALAARMRAEALSEVERARALADVDPWIVAAVLTEVDVPDVLLTRSDPKLRRLAVALATASSDAQLRAAAGAVAAGDANPWIRARAPELLGAEELRLLLDLTRDGDLGVRAAAADALAGRAEADPEIEALLLGTSASDSQRAAAYAFLCRRFDEDARSRAALGLSRGEPPIVEAELRAIGLAFGDDPQVAAPCADEGARARASASSWRDAAGHEPALAAPRVGRRPLGRTGIEVAPLGLSGVHELEPRALFDARRAGVNLFFWEPRHRHLTRFIRQSRAHRDDLVIVAGTYHADAPSIERDVASALERLRTDRLDLFLLFWARSPARLTGSTVDCLERLRRRGDVRAIGFSTHDRALAEAALADDRWDALMIRHSAAHPGAERSLFGAARARGVGVLTFSSLCYGRLLRARPGAAPDERPPSAADCYRYAIAAPGVSACISAPRRPRELAENLVVLAAPTLAPERAEALRAHGEWVHEDSARWNDLVRRGGARPARGERGATSDRGREGALGLLDEALGEPRFDA